MAFLSQVKENLPIYGIAKNKQLTDFCTSERDSAHGISRMPLELARIYEEDVKIEPKKRNFRVSPQSIQKNEMSDAEK